MSDSARSQVFAQGMLRGRAALVTGGGTGLGKATALELARCGARVVIAGRRAEVLEKAAGEIGAVRKVGAAGEVGAAGGAGARGEVGAGGHGDVGERVGAGRHMGAQPHDGGEEMGERSATEAGWTGCVDWVAGDVREPAGARRLVETALERCGRLDILVNNAGGQYFTPAEGIVAKGWRAVWRLNVEGMLNMAQAAVELGLGGAGAAGTEEVANAGEVANGREVVNAEEVTNAEEPGNAGAEVVAGRGAGGGVGGAIVNVTLSPHHGMPGMAHSGAARATVEALTRELAARWADRGIAVTAVAAGHFDTEAMEKYPGTVRAGMARSVPLQRLGRPEEHAWLVALLCSPLGRALNGSTVTIDGARDNWFGPWPPPGLTGGTGEVPTEERRGVRPS